MLYQFLPKKIKKMIEFLTRLFNKIAPPKQNNDDMYVIKIALYYFFLWYVLVWALTYLIYKNF